MSFKENFTAVYYIKVPFALQNGRGYDNHVKTAHDAYVCQTCQKVFEKQGKRSALERYKRHLETRCGKITQYKCSGSTCGETFTTKRAHQSHEGKCSFVIHKCTKCEKIFQNRLYLGRHKCTVIVLPQVPQQQQQPVAIPRRPAPAEQDRPDNRGDGS